MRTAWNRYGAGWLRRFGLQLVGAAAVLVALALGAGPLLRLLRMRRRVARVRRGQASVADATLLYKRMLHILKRRGYQKPVWFTPAEFAASLPRTELGAAVDEFTATYNALRFRRPHGCGAEAFDAAGPDGAGLSRSAAVRSARLLRMPARCLSR